VNPSDAILAEAREAIHAAAERVRAMPDLELVRLAMGGGAGVSDSTPEECADEGRAERVVAKPRTATRPKVSHNGLEGRQAQLYEIIKTNGPMRCGAIAKTIGISAGAVSGSMAPLMAKGLIEKEPGQLGAFRLAGTRQTGAKKTRKPPKGADEEEGAAIREDCARSTAFRRFQTARAPARARRPPRRLHELRRVPHTILPRRSSRHERPLSDRLLLVRARPARAGDGRLLTACSRFLKGNPRHERKNQNARRHHILN
jgi:hypothetical protein